MLFNRPNATLMERLRNLETHLQEEHPDLLQVLPTYRKLDKVLYRLGLLKDDESLATRITWWPLKHSWCCMAEAVLLLLMLML